MPCGGGRDERVGSDVQRAATSRLTAEECGESSVQEGKLTEQVNSRSRSRPAFEISIFYALSKTRTMMVMVIGFTAVKLEDLGKG